MYIPDLFFPKNPHYYGDTVRKLFLAGAVIALVFRPIYPDLVPLNSFLFIMAMIAIALVAGITNPEKYWTMISDLVIAGIAFIIFEYSAISQYIAVSNLNFSFIVKQSLGLIFFFALYYSSKTVRAMYLKKQSAEKTDTHKDSNREDI